MMDASCQEEEFVLYEHNKSNPLVFKLLQSNILLLLTNNISVNACDPRLRGLGFDSRSTGHV